jgi:hypothetical protein
VDTSSLIGDPLAPFSLGFAILDSSLNNILTADAASQFITIDINSPTSPTFGSSQSPFTILPPTVVPAGIPEPSRALLMLAVLMGGVVPTRRR